MRTRSVGRPVVESRGRGTGGRVGRGGMGRGPRGSNDERVDKLNGKGSDHGMGANGDVEGVNGNVERVNRVGNQGNVGSQNEFDDVRAPFNNRSSYFAFLITNYQDSATAFLHAPSLISVALLVPAAIPSLVRMLSELVHQHQVSRWLFHQTWLCSPYCSIMGDISYDVFVDSHRILSSLLFLCNFLYRDPAGMAAQKPYSSTGAGLVL
nr:hypothetical protein [Tanacetum cinerariifolium]